MRIAALDDDEMQLELVKRAMTACGHVCHVFKNGESLLKVLRRETFDMLILDWHLPDTTGPEIVKWVRAHLDSRVPVLFITNRHEERDIVAGLQAGADDFMVKPVRIGEMTARVEALLRRHTNYAPSNEDSYTFGHYRFIPKEQAIEVKGIRADIKAREYELALFLFQNQGQLLSRDHLRESIWGNIADIPTRTLDTHLSRLRVKLDLRPANGFLLTAVYGIGYRFESIKPEQSRSA